MDAASRQPEMSERKNAGDAVTLKIPPRILREAQLGVLWGELAPERDLSRAKQWYRQAIALLPMYTRALVHLAEIYSSEGSLNEAETLLRRVVAVRDPEVAWRLAASAIRFISPDGKCRRLSQDYWDVIHSRRCPQAARP
jgi:hypothetical protein